MNAGELDNMCLRDLVAELARVVIMLSDLLACEHDNYDALLANWNDVDFSNPHEAMAAINGTIQRCLGELKVIDENLENLYRQIGLVKYARDDRQ